MECILYYLCFIIKTVTWCVVNAGLQCFSVDLCLLQMTFAPGPRGRPVLAAAAQAWSPDTVSVCVRRREITRVLRTSRGMQRRHNCVIRDPVQVNDNKAETSSSVIYNTRFMWQLDEEATKRRNGRKYNI